MKTMKPWHWVLVGSVALNVFLGSAAIIHLARAPKGPPGPPPGGIIQDFARRLPAADAAVLMKAWDARKADSPAPEQTQDLFKQMDQAILAEPFDSERFATVLQKFHQQRRQEGEAVGLTLQDALPLMSVEGRRKLTEHPHGPPPPR